MDGSEPSCTSESLSLTCISCTFDFKNVAKLYDLCAISFTVSILISGSFPILEIYYLISLVTVCTSNITI